MADRKYKIFRVFSYLSSLVFLAPVLSGILADPAGAAEKNHFVLSSPAFAAGGIIAGKYGCGPERNPVKPSIPLSWSGAPPGTKSFILMFDDPHPVAKYWVHWLVLDIPAETKSLAEGASGKTMPALARELNNSFNKIGYGGPCPPSGSHTYRFRLYAMPTVKTETDFSGKRGDEIGKLINNHLAVAELSADFPE